MVKIIAGLVIMLMAAPSWALTIQGVTLSGQTISVTEGSGGGTGTDFTADANCMGAWFMNGDGTGDGNETDRSGEGETLTETSGTIPTSATVPSGYSGTSRDFEYDDAEMLTHADGGSTDISGADQSLSIVAWVKPESLLSNGTNQPIVSKHYVTNGERQYWLYFDLIEDDDVIGFETSDDGSNETRAYNGTDLGSLIGSWFHVAVVYNDTDIRIYINGILDSNGENNPRTYSSGIYNSPTPFRIGAYGSAAINGFDGLIDEVAVFDRALSAEEVEEIMTYGLDGTKGAND